MSLVEMHSVLARLYVDGTFLESFCAGPGQALARYDLTAREATALAGIDRDAIRKYAASLRSKTRARFEHAYRLLLALDAAARREGSRQTGRGLRFGFYACGWDLVTLPLGLLVLTVTDGPLSALRHSARGLTAPNSAAMAYLVHVHHFERDVARRASRRAVGFVFVPMLALIVLGFALGLAWAAR
jgi:hypothetical protein